MAVEKITFKMSDCDKNKTYVNNHYTPRVKFTILFKVNVTSEGNHFDRMMPRDAVCVRTPVAYDVLFDAFLQFHVFREL